MANKSLIERIEQWQQDDKQGYDVAIDLLCEALLALRARAEAPEPTVLTVVVNGQPVEVNSGSAPEVIQQAITKSGQIGAPVEQWELRTRDGEIIPHDLDADWELTGGRLLFLNLGLPKLRVEAPATDTGPFDFVKRLQRYNGPIDKARRIVEKKLERAQRSAIDVVVVVVHERGCL